MSLLDNDNILMEKTDILKSGFPEFSDFHLPAKANSNSNKYNFDRYWIIDNPYISKDPNINSIIIAYYKVQSEYDIVNRQLYTARIGASHYTKEELIIPGTNYISNESSFIEWYTTGFTQWYMCGELWTDSIKEVYNIVNLIKNKPSIIDMVIENNSYHNCLKTYRIEDLKNL